MLAGGARRSATRGAHGRDRGAPSAPRGADRFGRRRTPGAPGDLRAAWRSRPRRPACRAWGTPVTVERFQSPLELLGTGSPSLDRILGGGLPARSITLIAGEPGAGKTIFALQMLFHQARQGRKSLFFTTLAEPAVKLIRYMQLFSFFDPALVEGYIDFVDLGTALRAEGPDASLARVAACVERDGPDLVVVDSFKVIYDLAADPAHARTFTYDLAVHLAGWGATALLVGEYGTLDVARHPELGIADGIVL